MNIFYISPYRADKNIGKAINDMVNRIAPADDDWIVLTDHDVLFLQHNTKARIEGILRKTDYSLLGAKTNRIGVPSQLYGMFLSENDSVSDHALLAEHLYWKHGERITPTEGPVAAFLMCFTGAAYRRARGFYENNIGFDSLFTHAVWKAGLKIGIMEGIYVWHSYRLGSADAANDYQHLINQ